ncbi:unnamed protein product [Prorocentrum cordatum]|uniref:Pentacotripeptide-repeat region of PRORP domain-containing protein n=1 Tax=Prorocentrum cordatum TaxID=2364126 RepID=A0ABN9TBX4_9DINO|nr:unnamed protein product [Polarella glacialis]
MKSEGVTIARIVYHCIMMAFERSDPELTLTIFEEMEGLGMKPDGVAYNAVLGACCQLGMHERARHLFLQMAERELVPDRKSYSIMVKVCATSNQPEAALTFMGTICGSGASSPIAGRTTTRSSLASPFGAPSTPPRRTTTCFGRRCAPAATRAAL